MEDRFAYGLNPKKRGAVSAYLCDPASAPAEFLLTKSQYQAETGRVVDGGALLFRLPLQHISEPTKLREYAEPVCCLKKQN